MTERSGLESREPMVAMARSWLWLGILDGFKGDGGMHWRFFRGVQRAVVCVL